MNTGRFEVIRSSDGRCASETISRHDYLTDAVEAANAAREENACDLSAGGAAGNDAKGWDFYVWDSLAECVADEGEVSA